MLVDKGRADGDVNFTVAPADTNGVNIVFDIRDEQKIRIKTITFDGAEHFSDWELRWAMKKTRESHLFAWATGGANYTDETYGEDIEKVRELYLNEGFVEVSFGEPRMEYDDGSAFQVTLIFTGTNEEGTVTDSQGGSGTYTVNEYHFVEFTLVFPEVSYDYGGYFDGSHTISGSRERNTTANIFTGTFSATRITPTPTLLPKLSAADQPPSQSKTN